MGRNLKIIFIPFLFLLFYKISYSKGTPEGKLCENIKDFYIKTYNTTDFERIINNLYKEANYYEILKIYECQLVNNTNITNLTKLEIANSLYFYNKPLEAFNIYKRIFNVCDFQKNITCENNTITNIAIKNFLFLLKNYEPDLLKKYICYIQQLDDTSKLYFITYFVKKKLYQSAYDVFASLKDKKIKNKIIKVNYIFNTNLGYFYSKGNETSESFKSLYVNIKFLLNNFQIIKNIFFSIDIKKYFKDSSYDTVSLSLSYRRNFDQTYVSVGIKNTYFLKNIYDFEIPIEIGKDTKKINYGLSITPNLNIYDNNLSNIKFKTFLNYQNKNLALSFSPEIDIYKNCYQSEFSTSQLIKRKNKIFLQFKEGIRYGDLSKHIYFEPKINVKLGNKKFNVVLQTKYGYYKSISNDFNDYKIFDIYAGMEKIW